MHQPCFEKMFTKILLKFCAEIANIFVHLWATYEASITNLTANYGNSQVALSPISTTEDSTGTESMDELLGLLGTRMQADSDCDMELYELACIFLQNILITIPF